MRISYKYAVALTASLGLFMAVLDNTIVNVALIPFGRSFNADLNAVQWVITGYFLAQAAIIPAAGYFSSRIGIKPVFMACLALFTLASLLCGLSDIIHGPDGRPYIGLLIFFRVVQGLGGGALFPLAIAITFQVFPPEERATSSSITAVPVLMAPAFGPTVGGILIDSLGWQWIFFINVPVGILAIFLIWRIFQPEERGDRRPAAERFDTPGLLLSMAGVIALVYGFTLVSERNPATVSAVNPLGEVYGWGYGPVWLLVGTGLTLLAAFVVYELRVADPVMDLRLFQNRNFLTASILTWAMRGLIFGSFFLIPVFLESIRYPHLSATETGLSTMPMGLAAGVSVILVGKYYNRIGPRYIILIGLTLMALSNLLLLSLDNSTDFWSLAPAMLLRGLGFGASGIPLQTLAMQSIKGRALPKATSLFNVTAQIFSSVGIAVIATLFVQQTTAHAPPPAQVARLQETTQAQLTGAFVAARPGLDPAQVQSSPDYPALQAQINNTVRAQVVSLAGVPAVHDVFFVITVLTAALALLTFIIPKQAPPGRAEPEGLPQTRAAAGPRAAIPVE